MRVEPSWMRLVPLSKRPQRTSSLPPQHEEAEKSVAWERAPTGHGGTSDCQAPERWETSLLISHLVYGIFVLETQKDQNNCIYFFFFNFKYNLFLDSNILSTELSTQWWWLLFESFLVGTVYQLIIQAFPNALTWPIWVGKAIYPQTHAFLPIPRSDRGIVQRWINGWKKQKTRTPFYPILPTEWLGSFLFPYLGHSPWKMRDSEQRFLNLCTEITCEPCENADSDPLGLGRGLRLLTAADAAGPETRFWMTK